MAGATTTDELTQTRAEKAPSPPHTLRVEPKPLVRDGARDGASEGSRGGGLEVLASQAFLSPRVVDGRTFEELSGLLRELVAEAVRSGRTLSVASEQAGKAVEQLRALASAASSQVAVHVEAAGKALPAIDQRVRAAKELLDRVTSEAAALRGRGATSPSPAAPEQPRLDGAALAALREEWVRDAVERVREEAQAQARTHAQAAALAAVEPMVQASVRALVEASLAAQREESATLRDEVQSLRRELAQQRESQQRESEQPQSQQREGELARLAEVLRGSIDEARRTRDEAEATLRRSTLEHARGVEACASEVVEQLAALRQDAARIVHDARAELSAARGDATSAPAGDAAPARGAEALRLLRDAQRDALALLDERLERAQGRLEEVVASGVLRVRRAQPERSPVDLEKADAAAEELSDLIAKAQRAGAVLHEQTSRMGERVEGAAFAMDRIEERLAHIGADLSVNPSDRAGDDARGAALPDLEELRRSGDDLEAVLGEAYGVGEWLRQLLECAQDAGPRLSESLSSARTTIAALRSASLAANASLSSAARTPRVTPPPMPRPLSGDTTKSRVEGAWPGTRLGSPPPNTPNTPITPPARRTPPAGPGGLPAGPAI